MTADSGSFGNGRARLGPSAGLQVSFEFFPPKTPESAASLWRAVERLAPMAPRFVSVTYGAGGSTRERTHQTVVRLQREAGLQAAAHLTCVGASRADVDAVAKRYWQAGIRHIVALRGDPPSGEERFVPHPDGYQDSVELITGLRRIADFEISVGAYPEIHPDASSAQADLEYLKRKVEAGATRVITQYFFDPEAYFRFLDRAYGAGLAVPIVPGILPVTNYTTVKRFSAQCGASVPAWMTHLFEGLEDDPTTRRMVAAVAAAEQCNRLKAAGIDEFHFYTLNRADLTYAICHILGLRASTEAAASGDRAA